MIEYTFKYNLPADNSQWNLVHTMIEVRATLLPKGGIALEFPMMPAALIFEVINWHKAIDEMKALAKIEFDMRLAVNETTKVIAA